MFPREILERIRAEFVEMPGLRLTLDQVARLCGAERTQCKAALDALVETKILWLKSDGRYTRLTEGHLRLPLAAPARSHAQIAKAS